MSRILKDELNVQIIANLYNTMTDKQSYQRFIKCTDFVHFINNAKSGNVIKHTLYQIIINL